MAIYKKSRYEYSKVSFVQTKAAGYPKPIVFFGFPPLAGKQSYIDHTYVEGERLDQISYKYYGSPKWWWYIALNNPSIKDVNNIPVGFTIRVPRV